MMLLSLTFPILIVFPTRKVEKVLSRHIQKLFPKLIESGMPEGARVRGTLSPVKFQFVSQFLMVGLHF